MAKRQHLSGCSPRPARPRHARTPHDTRRRSRLHFALQPPFARGEQYPAEVRAAVTWLRRAGFAHAVATLGVPGLSPATNHHWLGPRWSLWPFGVPPFRRWSLVSSRLPRALDELPEWFERLREALVEVRIRQGLLVCVEDTAADRYTRHAAPQLGISILDVQVDVSPKSLWRKVTALVNASRSRGNGGNGGGVEDVDTNGDERIGINARRATASSRAFPVWLTRPLPSSLELAPIHLSNTSEIRDSPLDSLPPRDRAACALADEIRVLAARRGGVIERLVGHRLAADTWPRDSVQSLDKHAAPPMKTRSGAVAHQEAARTTRELAERTALNLDQLNLDSRPLDLTPPASAIARTEPPLGGPLLLHCTRRQDGPWPGQTECEYCDELLWQHPARDRSPAATLERLIVEARLRGSAAAIRGGTPVVCFTAESLERLAGLRRYQVHRQRWDFEPYGIAIDRDWLMERGARPVIYGDDDVWRSLSDAERPYFQLHATRGVARRASRGGVASQSADTDQRNTRNWTVEREWRVVGDIDLTQLPPGRAFVFVPREQAAERLRPLSCWPVLVIPDRR